MPNQFFDRWAGRLPESDREQFLMELAALLTLEQARERRRLCTDRDLYRRACEETSAEVKDFAGAGGVARRKKIA
jgi:hypothetical protein